MSPSDDIHKYISEGKYQKSNDLSGKSNFQREAAGFDSNRGRGRGRGRGSWNQSQHSSERSYFENNNTSSDGSDIYSKSFLRNSDSQSNKTSSQSIFSGNSKNFPQQKPPFGNQNTVNRLKNNIDYDHMELEFGDRNSDRNQNSSYSFSNSSKSAHFTREQGSAPTWLIGSENGRGEQKNSSTSFGASVFGHTNPTQSVNETIMSKVSNNGIASTQQFPATGIWNSKSPSTSTSNSWQKSNATTTTMNPFSKSNNTGNFSSTNGSTGIFANNKTGVAPVLQPSQNLSTTLSSLQGLAVTNNINIDLDIISEDFNIPISSASSSTISNALIDTTNRNNIHNKTVDNKLLTSSDDLDHSVNLCILDYECKEGPFSDLNDKNIPTFKTNDGSSFVIGFIPFCIPSVVL